MSYGLPTYRSDEAAASGEGPLTKASPACGNGKLLAFLAPDFTEVSTITRARSFREHEFEVAVFAFRRARYNQGFRSPWPEIELGRTTDGRYVDRFIKLAGAVPVLWRNRALLRRAAVLYGRNIDQLLLAVMARMFMGARGRVVYEVLDVAEIFTRGGISSTVMRWAERRLLRRTDNLVVSSPAFYSEYFRDRQGYRGTVHVVENRLHRDDAAAIGTASAAPTPVELPRGNYKWVVGYFGLIRGRPTFDLMARVAERCPHVLFYLRGILTTIDPEYFKAMLRDHPNMVYGGDYVNPRDLEQLYGAIDFTWAIDLERERSNSRWLMPCRFFESSLLGVPSLAVRDFEVGRRIESLGIGWAIAPGYEESMARLFEELTRADYERVTTRLKAMPAENFLAGDDVAKLCAAMAAPRA